jgi:hypothetical protein
MKSSLRFALAGSVVLGGIGVAGTAVSAMPLQGLDPAIATPADQQAVQNVGWVCGPYHHCHWVRPYYRPWGYYGGWRGYGWRGYGYHHYGWRHW